MFPQGIGFQLKWMYLYLQVLQDYMDGVIDHKLKEAAERLAGDCTEAPKRQAFLDMVIQSGTNVPLSKEEIRDEVCFILPLYLLTYGCLVLLLLLF